MDWISENEVFINLPANKLLAIAAYGEAANQGAEGLMAVLNVIKNRTKEVSKYGDPDILRKTNSPYHAVILKKWQFSMFNLDDPVRDTALRFAKQWDAYYGANATLRKAYDLATMLLTGLFDDNTYGATHYHTAAVNPQWASTIPFIGQIGDHLFYGEGGGMAVATASMTFPLVAFALILPLYFILRKKR